MKADDSFFQRVFEVVKKVPYGRVTSYGAIAEYLGMKGSSRMVGWAMNASHTANEKIPAHRVVNRNGDLTGKFHFASPNLMEELLISEGIQIKNDRVQDFKNKYWNPNLELSNNDK
jgi:methylated-DNA-protein-cysteine methyltransferase related protein